jgi:predicted lipoprotein with Yx(FWY)xxD motif
MSPATACNGRSDIRPNRVRKLILPIAIGALLAALGGCGTTGHQTTHAVTPSNPATHTTAPARRPTHAAAVGVTRTAYGRALVDRRGFALYLFTHDRSAASTCCGACAAVWPPYVVAKRRLAAGSRLGVVRRADGRLQVTYVGHPLYYYVGDRRPGQVLCQAVAEFGGTWYVVAPNGQAIR